MRIILNKSQTNTHEESQVIQPGQIPMGAVPDLGALGRQGEVPLAPLKADCLRMAIQAVSALGEEERITDTIEITRLADQFFLYIFGDAPAAR